MRCCRVKAPMFGDLQNVTADRVLATVMPTSSNIVVTGETISSLAGRMVFRATQDMAETAILHRIAATPAGVSSAVVSVVSGPGKGQAKIVPVTEFIAEGWRLASPQNEYLLFSLGFTYPTKFPVTIEQLDTAVTLIENYVKHARDLLAIDDFAASRVAIQNARDSHTNAFFYLKVLSDFGAITPGVAEVMRRLISDISGRFGEVSEDIERQKDPVLKRWDAALSAVASAVMEVASVFSSDLAGARKLFLGHLAYMESLRKLVLELSKLERTELIDTTITVFSRDLQGNASVIASLRKAASDAGTTLEKVFEVESSDLGALPAALTAVVAVVVSTVVSTISMWLVFRHGTQEETEHAQDREFLLGLLHDEILRLRAAGKSPEEAAKAAMEALERFKAMLPDVYGSVEDVTPGIAPSLRTAEENRRKELEEERKKREEEERKAKGGEASVYVPLGISAAVLALLLYFIVRK